jgi:di/tricarboxylate transporter
VGDAVPAVVAAVALFLLPSRRKRGVLRYSSHWSHVAALHCDYSGVFVHVLLLLAGETLMDWDTMQRRFPWDVLLLLGAGFALASGFSKADVATVRAPLNAV